MLPTHFLKFVSKSGSLARILQYSIVQTQKDYKIMSAPNFSYDRRCVLVSNDDYETGNVPEIGDGFDNDRSYPSAYLADYKDDFSTIAIVITSGYYADACIDILDDNRLVGELSCCDYHFARLTRDELYDELCYYFHGNISKRMMLRHLKGLNVRDDDYQSKLSYAIDAIFEEIRDKEVKKANKVLDEIKKSYGYRELTRTALFSNGEAWYDYID
jgi:hypothetical protein